jgi:hypothetical protein
MCGVQKEAFHAQKFLRLRTRWSPLVPQICDTQCMINENYSAQIGDKSSHTIKPEWLRVPEAVRIFGIGRSTLYALIQEQKIKSCSLRKRGAIRGIRLISYDSLSAFIERQSQGACE